MPEESVSLKVVFDNVRNYLMCAATVAAVGALSSATGSGVVPWTLLLFAGLLILANTIQSWLIIERWTSRIGRFQKEVRPQWGKFKRRLMRTALILVLTPVLAGVFQGFMLLALWAIRGGK